MVIGIDLGSNTIRAALMSDDYMILKSMEFIVGSARGLKEGKKLNALAKERICKALETIKNEFEFNNFAHVGVATEAFRMASDSVEFFSQIKTKFGINFKIIDGKSEAKFIELAVKTRLEKLRFSTMDLLIIDLGGASTEVAFNGHYESFKFGIVRFHNEFLTYENMQNHADEVVKDAKEFIINSNSKNIVLTSGVPTTMVALNLGLDYASYNPNLVNGQKIKFSDFDKTAKEILALDDEEASKKVGENRAVYIVGATFLLKSLLKDFKEREFVVVDDGLREGIMIDYINKTKERK
ncbi:hypothetical protein [Campylobacter geochelonis]|uniref:Ppx/GppA phosphatase family protein n=1 Tax=Campylobacter geochelonis TaxID=1780362 RepID=UPI000770832F|nr:hypothetical protein [Campylobacter geochelonis]CZE51235.1 Ppx/GppA family phosphatase [Campylobacter geochelonis]